MSFVTAKERNNRYVDSVKFELMLKNLEEALRLPPRTLLNSFRTESSIKSIISDKS